VRFLDTGRMAASALVRAPLRTAMLLLATGIGVGAVLVLTALGEAARRYVTDEFQALGTDLLIVLPGRTETTGIGPAMLAGETPRDLTLDDTRAIQRLARIQLAAPVMIGSAAVSAGGLEREVSVLGTTADLLAIRQWKMGPGQFLPAADMEIAAPVCVLGAKVASELLPGETPIGEWLRVGDRRCRVIGLMAPAGRGVMVDVNEIVIVPVAFAQALFDSPGLFRIITQAASRDAVPAAKRDMIDVLKRQHRGEEDVTVITQDAVLSTFDEIFGALTLALAGIAAISLVVAGVLIMNVMLVAVSQRTQEIGLIKALGARRRQIMTLFLVEAVLLSLVGGLTGVAAGYGAAAALGGFYPGLQFVPPDWASAGALGIAVACGVGFGILPARRAAALDPIAALARR